MELPIPPAAAEAPKSREIARIWAAGGAQHVTIDADLWEDPACWGLMLVDLAQHVADAYEKRGLGQRAEVLERIREGLDAEWSNPTDKARGEFLE